MKKKRKLSAEYLLWKERRQCMKKHKKLIIGVVLMVLITLGVYILFKGDGNSIFIGDDTTQAVEFNDINLNEEKDGKVIWNLRARHVRMESDRNTVYLTDIEGFFAEDGNELSIKAKKGVIKRAEQTVNLEGDIEGKTKDGLILYAKNLTYDGKKQVLSTDCSFTAEKDGRILTADSFTADRVLEKIIAKGHAKLADKEANK
nr:MAG TPA: LPS export ABC transporter periplasmic protein [Caudoviricetes sp.]